MLSTKLKVRVDGANWIERAWTNPILKGHSSRKRIPFWEADAEARRAQPVVDQKASPKSNKE